MGFETSFRELVGNIKAISLAAAMFLFLLLHRVHSATILDATDKCILVCDRCYKDEILLNCANDCLFTYGKIYQHWKKECPYFFDDLPSVLQT
ncbi:hypothetical protein NQ317_016124 [Molorchus minor]|uniref:Uncharacterized protein n=1 Tax=Molorchus minor TaxID=1323400 RepID=A0ABQ9J8G7_9CUCU|nr:hypothetical protein NQ317_016124 [Molorchus minor]